MSGGTMIKVYCAGKIAREDWRGEFFKGLGLKLDWLELESDGTLLGNAPLPTPIHGEFQYTGPFFINCQHGGCFFGKNEHGVGAWEDTTGGHGPTPGGCGGYAPSRFAAKSLCLAGIDKADVVFVWLNTFNAFGTLGEIGYAIGKGKPVWLYESWEDYDLKDDIWFVKSMATESRGANSPQEAFRSFSQDFPWHAEIARRERWGAEKARPYLRAAGSQLTPRVVTQGFVYFLQAGPYVKIGKSLDIDRRLNQLAIQLPDKAALVHSVRADHMDAAEVYYHAAFQDLRRNGEWFELSPKHLQWVRRRAEWDSRFISD